MKLFHREGRGAVQAHLDPDTIDVVKHEFRKSGQRENRSVQLMVEVDDVEVRVVVRDPARLVREIEAAARWAGQ